MKYNVSKQTRCKFNSKGLCIYHDHPGLGSKICPQCKEPFKSSNGRIYCVPECKELFKNYGNIK